MDFTHGPPGPRTTRAVSLASAPLLQLLISAETTSLSAIRRRLHDWLLELICPEEALHDLVLAVSEACSNSVAHAYPVHGTSRRDVAVEGRLSRVSDEECHIVILVRDWGMWRPESQARGFRGRGLALMRTCVGDMLVQRGEGGTDVTLTSSIIPCRP